MASGSLTLRLSYTLTRTKADFVPLGCGECADVCVRPDGFTNFAQHRQWPHGPWWFDLLFRLLRLA